MEHISLNGADAKNLDGVLGAHLARDSEPPETEIAFTIVQSENGRLTKAFGLDASRKLKAEPPPYLSKGTASRIALKGSPSAMADELARWIMSFGDDKALIPAPPPPGKDVWPVVTAREVESTPGAIARTKDHFKLQSGPALLALDFDFKNYPDRVRYKLGKAGGLSAALASVCPQLAGAACVIRPSVSSGLRIRENGEEWKDTGQHRYLFALDGEDAPSFAQRLADRLALADWRWGEVSKTGTVLFRDLFDLGASSDPSRLFYEANAVLTSPELERMKDAREAKVTPGAFLDTRALPPLTEAEIAQLARVNEAITQELGPDCLKTRERWQEQRVRDLVRKGSSPEAAQRAVSGAVERRALEGDFEIVLDDGTSVTVREILANPDAFHRRTCADPLEPDYRGGKNIAVIFGDGFPIRIHSLAHGGIDYRLERPPEYWFDDLTQAGEDAPETQPATAGALFEGADHNSPARRKLRFIRSDKAAEKALATKATPLVQGLLDRGAMSTIYGQPGIGKSFVMLKLAYCVALGRPFGGRSVTQGAVAYVAAEGGGGIFARVKALQDSLGAHDAEGLPVQFHLLPETVNLREPGADLQPMLDALTDLEKHAGRFALIVVDTLARAMGGGDENSPVDMGRLVANLDTIRMATGAHVAVVHHCGKDAARGMRGHSSLLGAIDTELEVTEGVVTAEKQRDMESGESFRYRLHPVVIGMDANDMPVRTAFAKIEPMEDATPRDGCTRLTAMEAQILEFCSRLNTPFTLRDIGDEIETAGQVFKPESVRATLNKLRRLNVVEKVRRGAWRLHAQRDNLSSGITEMAVCAQKGSGKA